jgi:hypothetical protein
MSSTGKEGPRKEPSWESCGLTVRGFPRCLCQTRSAAPRLDPDVLEDLLLQDLAVGHTVEGDTAGQAEVVRGDLRLGPADDLLHDFLEHYLDGGGQVHVHPAEGRLGLAAGHAEELLEGPAGHGQAGMVVEVLEVQAEGAVFADVDEVLVDKVLVFRLAIGGQAHQLVLARVDPEAAEVGEGGVEHPQRIGESHPLDDLEVVALGPGHRQGVPLADGVDGQDGGVLEGRGVEGRGDVRGVVGGEKDLQVRPPDLLPEGLLDEQPLLGPQRDGLEIALEPARGELEIGREEPVELLHGLFIEDRVVQVLGLSAGELEAGFDGLGRESGVVLLAREALFLRGEDHPAVLDQADRAVVVESRNTEDQHPICIAKIGVFGKPPVESRPD